jgi:hypothetical protein
MFSGRSSSQAGLLMSNIFPRFSDVQRLGAQAQVLAVIVICAANNTR